VARPTILSLFSGVGGLDLGIQIALPGARVLGYVERDAYAAAVLLARMEDSSLEPAPVWIGDIQDVDGSELRGRVDIVCGGFPCQDISIAGKGEGIGGKRSGLFYELMRLVDDVRPQYIFLENVSAITHRGLDAVLARLAESGFDAEWLCLRAGDVGAPHRRERWFCLAYATDDHWGRGERRAEEGTRKDGERRGGSSVGGDAMANAEGSLGRQREQGRGPEGGASTGWTSAIFPPGPSDFDAWRGVPPHFAPAIESGLRVLVDELAMVVDESRADQLRCAGNGVVPLCAAVAFTELMRRIA